MREVGKVADGLDWRQVGGKRGQKSTCLNTRVRARWAMRRWKLEGVPEEADDGRHPVSKVAAQTEIGEWTFRSSNATCAARKLVTYAAGRP